MIQGSRRMTRPRLIGFIGLGLVASCAGGSLKPAPLDIGQEACRFCRMTIADARSAGQIVAPGEEALFFDDVGCLGNYVKQGELPERAVTYVTDHRTKAWVPASQAIYTRVASLETPMGSHIIAHEDAASRDADPDARTGVPVVATEIFGRSGAPRRSANRVAAEASRVALP